MQGFKERVTSNMAVGHQHSSATSLPDHNHSPGNIATAFFLNTGFAIIELVGGFFTNSVAIMSDALHDFGDSISLGAAWYFQRKSKKGRSPQFSYGYQRFSLAGAFINATVLLIGSIFIIREAIERLFQPEPAHYQGMIILAILGILVNGAAMMRLKKGESINEKVVSLHFLEDVMGWVAVLLGALVMMFFDAPIIDPILSLLIAGFVLFNIYRNIKPAFRIMLQGVPDNISEERVKELVMREGVVSDAHDIRIWSLDGLHHVASLHVVTSHNMDLKTAEQLKEKIKHHLEELHISHATIEVEFEPDHADPK